MENYGDGILKIKYNGSIYELLRTVYPQVEWLPWKFVNSPRNYWKNVENHRKFLLWLGEKKGIKNQYDWYHNISNKVIYYLF